MAYNNENGLNYFSQIGSSSTSRSYTISKSALQTLSKGSKDFNFACSTMNLLNITCKGQVSLTILNRNYQSNYQSVSKLVSVRFLKYQSNKMHPYNPQLNYIQLQSSLAQYIDMASYGPSTEVLHSEITLLTSPRDIKKEVRICRNFSACDFESRLNWRDLLESQTKLLPTIKYDTSNGAGMSTVIGFKKPGMKLRRDEKAKSVRVYIFYNILQPEDIEYMTEQQSMQYR